jgi:hypothetical protein
VSRPLADRFWQKIVRDPDTGCWEWTGSLNSHGYGQIWGGADVGRPLLAHRVAYELLAGPIPADLTIDHLCRNRACVNPTHLEAVTMTENWSRGESVPAQRARQTHCKNGHALTGANLVQRGPDGRHRGCRICIRELDRKYARRAAA